jgi:hypothetical protein
MVATGVPRDIRLMGQVEALDKKCDRLETAVLGLGEAVTQRMDQMEESLPEKVASQLLKKVNVEGAVPLTEDVIVKIIQENLRMVREEVISALTEKISEARGEPSSKTTDGAVVDPAQNRNYVNYVWSNPRNLKCLKQPQNHPVPMGLTLPRNNCCDCWILWHHGNQERNCPPYRILDPFDFDIAAEATQLSRIRGVMDCILQFAVKEGAIEDGAKVTNLPIKLSHEVFEKGFRAFLCHLYGKDIRYFRTDQSIATLYNVLRKKDPVRKRKAPTNAGETCINLDV